jgi:hypothetical protein
MNMKKTTELVLLAIVVCLTAGCKAPVKSYYYENADAQTCIEFISNDPEFIILKTKVGFEEGECPAEYDSHANCTLTCAAPSSKYACETISYFQDIPNFDAEDWQLSEEMCNQSGGTFDYPN